MQYTLVSVIMGYVTKMPPGWLAMAWALINVPSFCMEMSFKLCGTLKITASDDLGPIEVEIIMALIFIIAGVLGVSGVDSNVPFLPEGILWKHFVLVLAGTLYVLFSLDGLSRSFS